jgi:hypothetical protein
MQNIDRHGSFSLCDLTTTKHWTCLLADPTTMNVVMQTGLTDAFLHGIERSQVGVGIYIHMTDQLRLHMF